MDCQIQAVFCGSRAKTDVGLRDGRRLALVGGCSALGSVVPDKVPGAEVTTLIMPKSHLHCYKFLLHHM
ncbi:MAG TPA: hypothetical protein ACFCUD_11540 [Cyclobacteriaceae bacterium]